MPAVRKRIRGAALTSRSPFLRTLAAALGVSVALGGAARAQPAGVDAAACALPDQLLALEVPLPRTRAAVLYEGSLVILAVGSSSTFGTGASDASRSYPALLKQKLSSALPTVDVRVLNRGRPGETTDAMLERLREDIPRERPDLILWQPGVNDAEVGRDPGHVQQEVAVGVAEAAAAGVDILLMGPQYLSYRRNRYDLYVEAIKAAGGGNAGYIDRAAAMRHWHDSGQLPLRQQLSLDQFHMNDAGYACLAGMVADIVIRAVQGSPQTAHR